MNASDILKYGNLTILHELSEFPADYREKAGACGFWSVKDIVAHLASYELVLVDVLNESLGHKPVHMLDLYRTGGHGFNDEQVETRKSKDYDAVLAEYNEAHARVMSLLSQIPVETLRQPGTLPWYGADYAIDDYLVYAFYGHKREHGAQVAAFRDIVKKA